MGEFLLRVLKTIIFGIVEGITEWLPISSTGHLIILEDFIGTLFTDEFMSMFDVVIQLGAILAVVWIYFEKLNPFDNKKTRAEKEKTIRLWVKVIVATIPAAVLGLLLDDWLDAHLFNVPVVACTLIIYGIAFILIENRNSRIKNFKYRSVDRLPMKTAFMIGMFQVLSLIPGTSRSGSTIIGGLLLGTSRPVATEFTFFLAIPVMFGASALKLFKFGLAFTPMQVFLLLLGMIVSFAVSVIAIKFLMKYIKNHDFKAFGYYRIVLGIVVFLFFGIQALFK